MTMLIRTALISTMLMVAAALPATGQTSPPFPSRLLTLVVPVGPGGSYDYLGRLLGEGLSRELGQAVVVENKPGAGTVVGTTYAVKSAPDGYTMVVGGVGSIAQAPALTRDLPYNPTRDLMPLQLVSTNGYTLIARPDLAQKTLPELIAYARANPGKLTIGTPGQGSGQAVGAALLKSLAGIDLLEVQFKGAPPIYTELLAGRIDLFFDGTGTAQPFIKSGKVKAIATSGETRELTDVPTFRESGLPELVLSSWTGLFVPAATPRPVVLRLRQAIDKVVASPAFREQLGSRSFSPFTTPDVEAFVRAENQRWPGLLAKAGVKPQ
ncbi:MAG: tripartite tricarboxylate transporter substrate binding protein [Pseudomonadota bacterium]